MDTIRLTASGAAVRYLAAQRIEVEGRVVPLFAGVFAIFGHGNVTCLGHELEQAGEALPTWRGQNEQGMALAAVAFAKANRRRRIMAATSSIGPGATNMVTAAAVAMANRMPLLLLAGDTFNSRIPDPVLQQVEHFGNPTLTVNDAFRPVVRYWDRITAPEQVVHSLPHALATMLDPGDCGPAFISLPQDVQADAFDFPSRFFEETIHEIRRPRPDAGELRRAAAALAAAKRPVIVAGGGVHWSLAEDQLRAFAEAHAIPVVETVAGRTSLTADHPLNCGPIGVTGCTSANAMAAEADAVLAVGTRLGDFVTGSWTVFGGGEGVRIIGLNAARFDASKHRSLPLVADAREGLAELGAALGGYRAPEEWSDRAASETSQYHAYIDKIAAPEAVAAAGQPSEGAADQQGEPPSYAQVVGAVDRLADESTYVLAAAGGFPGELVNGWRAKTVHSFDCEYGYSCMGYEISGGWGAKMALPDREVVVLVGDGSYLMMNSDLYSTVLTGHKLIVIVCDNGGYAVINRLQTAQGGVPFNNLIADSRVQQATAVDFAAHAASMGCGAETAASIAELEAALGRARASARTYVIALNTHAHRWTEGGSFWEVGVPEVSASPEVRAARAAMESAKGAQRVGW
ncbi:MAG: 3D-(3,5/4)-trihydroxycyclohexane-1,2-dione acylhydrolase (decyclizing) [bacterium]|nr:3D-(3,5/4)-trihydroxycyclohexane-1,2-dione acylhydrolase (decyclizing) [bacterium]MCY4271594.1 3D-(3,5/4)-trihydroxycyclohexane-1,2-dione acylhydrolase (decyclizing) [bacterium]